jgi:hypothetical protein
MHPERLTPQPKLGEKVIPNYNGLHTRPSPDLPFFGRFLFDPEGYTCSKKGYFVLVDL